MSPRNEQNDEDTDSDSEPDPYPHQQEEARKRLEAGETQRSVARSYNQSEHDFAAELIEAMKI